MVIQIEIGVELSAGKGIESVIGRVNDEIICEMCWGKQWNKKMKNAPCGAG